MTNENDFELNAGGCIAIPAQITLRDWFAGMALTGIVSATQSEQMKPASPGEAAYWAYSLADAMIQAREKSK